MSDLREWSGLPAGFRAAPIAAAAAFRPAAPAAEAAAARRHRPCFVHRQSPSAKRLLIELGDRILRVLVGHHLDERKPAGAAGFPVERADDLRWLTDLREMRPQIVFGRLVGQIAHEQSDWWQGSEL